MSRTCLKYRYSLGVSRRVYLLHWICTTAAYFLPFVVKIIFSLLFLGLLDSRLVVPTSDENLLGFGSSDIPAAAKDFKRIAHSADKGKLLDTRFGWFQHEDPEFRDSSPLWSGSIAMKRKDDGPLGKEDDYEVSENIKFAEVMLTDSKDAGKDNKFQGDPKELEFYSRYHGWVLDLGFNVGGGGASPISRHKTFIEPGPSFKEMFSHHYARLTEMGDATEKLVTEASSDDVDGVKERMDLYLEDMTQLSNALKRDLDEKRPLGQLTFPLLGAPVAEGVRDSQLPLRKRAATMEAQFVLQKNKKLVADNKKRLARADTKYLIARAHHAWKLRSNYAEFKTTYFWNTLNGENSEFHLGDCDAENKTSPCGK
jgi:hypothetical protein